MNRTIHDVRLRGILNSCGQPGFEAEVRLADGSVGRGSTAAALAPGRRERPRSAVAKLGPVEPAGAVQHLLESLRGATFRDQAAFDSALESNEVDKPVGTDITLAISLGHARARATAGRNHLVDELHDIGIRPALPHPLVNLFSGGIHGVPLGIPFQQIMILPNLKTLAEDIDAAVAVYDSVEAEMKARSLFCGYSPSSGMLTPALDYEAALAIVREHITRLGYGDSIRLAFDAAAEHLRLPNGTYRIAGRQFSGERLLDLYLHLAQAFDIAVIEDPFDPADAHLWGRLTAAVGDRVTIVGDDLFASNPSNVVAGMANAILLKMNQVGTISATVRAAAAARSCGMKSYVSHRSCETEDTAMCDLSVAVAAEAIKIGGPRRGDRICKYNRLLELSETFGADGNPKKPNGTRSV